jgi:hypothetical protein
MLKGITSSNVRTVYIVLSFQYNLNQQIEADMKSLAFIQIDTPNGIGSVDAYGQLKLRQLRALQTDYTK